MADSTSTPPGFESSVLTISPAADSGAVTIRDDSSTVKTLVRSDRRQFGVVFGGSRSHGDALVAGTRPGEWLILGTADAVAEAEAAVDRGGFTSVIPFTHGRALFTIIGGDSARMLEKVCGIDWADNMTPDGAVVSASVALVSCDIIRRDTPGDGDGAASVRSYQLVFDRSFGQYLYDALVDAGAEFDIGVA